MKIEHLQYFVTLVTMPTPSISRAAEKLFISQQQLNRIMSALEEEVNCILLERSPKGITLTKEGRVFLDYAYKLINDYTAMKDYFLLLNSTDVTTPIGEAVNVRIMVTPTLFMYSAEIIKRLQIIAPNITLRIEEFDELPTDYIKDALYFWPLSLPENVPESSVFPLCTASGCFVHRKGFHLQSDATSEKVFLKKHSPDMETDANIRLISNNLDVILETILENNIRFELFDFCIPKINEKYPELDFTIIENKQYSISCITPADYVFTDADEVVINFIRSYIDNLKLMSKHLL